MSYIDGHFSLPLAIAWSLFCFRLKLYGNSPQRLTFFVLQSFDTNSSKFNIDTAKISSPWNSRGTFVTITVSIGLWMVSLAEEPPSRLEGQCSTICFLILSLSICTMHVLLISSARSPWSSYSLMSVISFGPYFWQIPILITTLLRLAYLLSTTKHFFQSKTGLLLTWLDFFSSGQALM